jgi:hypothetical protein
MEIYLVDDSTAGNEWAVLAGGVSGVAASDSGAVEIAFPVADEASVGS